MAGKVITFGCRLNACESETIENFVQELGLDDYTIINTCAVTAEAERKLRQTIRRLHSEDNSVKIILTGCAAEVNRDLYMKMDGVVGVIPNDLKLSKAEYEKYSCKNNSNNTVQSSIVSEGGEKSELDTKIGENFEKNGVFAKKMSGNNQKTQKVRGFLQIQNGCDQKCTYCIVRFTRGPNISLDADEIVEQAKKLLSKGYKDIILTGVNVSAYGRDLSPKKNLAYIINYLLKNVPQLRRLGLSSLDPADIDDDLIRIIANEERLLPHIHESIQSGDNMILKRMMRRHSREQVIETNQKILEGRSDVIFGADIICGFPTETDEMFQNTKKLMTEANITLLHAFPFSKRPGTPAAKMPSVDKSIAKNRLRELKNISQQILHSKLQEYIGQEVIILAEDEKNAKTNSFLKVKSRKKMQMGCEYIFKCEEIEKDYLVGIPLKVI